MPAYTMAPKTENFKMLRVVVREDFTRSRCEALITDVKLCMQLLEKMDNDAVKRQQDFINKHHLHSGKATHNHPKYKVRFDQHCHRRSFASAALPPPILPKAHGNSCRDSSQCEEGLPARNHLSWSAIISLAESYPIAFAGLSAYSTNDMGSRCQAEAETKLTYFYRMRSTLCRARRGRPMQSAECGQLLCRALPIEGRTSLGNTNSFLQSFD